MLSTRGTAASALGVCAMLVMVSSTAHAQFAPIACSPSTYVTVPGYTFNTDEFGADPNCVATTGDPCPHYIPNFHNFRYFLANRYVRDVELRFSQIDTEGPYDTLEYGEWPTLSSVTGSIPTPTTRVFTVPTNDSLQASPTLLEWTSDDGNADEGVTIDQVRVRCSSTGSDNARLTSWNYRTTGLLLGTNDVMYAATFGFSNIAQSIAVWSPAAGLDADVYVRCNARPTATTWTYSTQTQVLGDFLVMPAGECAGGVWHMAFVSGSGSGAFQFMLSPYYPNHQQNTEVAHIRVGTQPALGGATFAQIGSVVRDAARLLYGISEGGIQIGTISMFNNGDCDSCEPGGGNCHICFVNSPGTGYCCDNFPTGPDELGLPNPHGRIQIFNSYFNSVRGVAHEMAHGYMFIWDEYTGGGTPLCGHSITGTLACDGICQTNNHGLDRAPGQPPPGGLADSVEFFNNGFTPWQPQTDYNPDMHHFTDFGFSNNRAYLWWR
jgi:hypothetical protein